MVQDAERRAAQLVSQQEITARANMEAEELKQSTKEEIERLYHDVYQHIDEVLAQLDRTISEKLTDIRMTRQQIDQSIRVRRETPAFSPSFGMCGSPAFGHNSGSKLPPGGTAMTRTQASLSVIAVTLATVTTLFLLPYTPKIPVKTATIQRGNWTKTTLAEGVVQYRQQQPPCACKGACCARSARGGRDRPEGTAAVRAGYPSGRSRAGTSGRRTACHGGSRVGLRTGGRLMEAFGAAGDGKSGGGAEAVYCPEADSGGAGRRDGGRCTGRKGSF